MKTYSRPTIIEAYKMFFQYTFLFSARSRRGEFIPIFIGNTVIFIFIFFICIIFSENGYETISNIILLTLFLIYFILMIPWISLMCRRLHDIGKNSLWLLTLALPMVGWATYFYFLLLMVIGDSQKENNEWGESPKYYDYEE